jgi:DNA-binding PadR family transcriptional regulator
VTHREKANWEGARGRQRRRGPWWDDWSEQFGGSAGPWGGRRGGPRARRGDIRRALLSALEDGPAHGYELITRLEGRSGGMWRPSPGSVYPTLQMLEDEGLVRSEEREGKRVYELTDAGRTAAAEREPAGEWAGPGGPGHHRGFRNMRLAGEKIGPVLAPLVMALRQLAVTGDEAQMERGQEILRRATKELNQILAED